MQFIIRPSRCGKTTDLIRRALANNAGIVVANEKMRKTLYRQVRDIRCFTAAEIKEKRYRGKGVKEIVIDDIEMFLQNLFPDILVIAVSGTDTAGW